MEPNRVRTPAAGERTLTGVAAGPGTATGPVAVLAPPPTLPERRPRIGDPGAETARAVAALERVAELLRGWAAEAGGAAGEILEAQAAMAGDPQLAAGIGERVREGLPAEWALDAAVTSYQELFRSMGGYLAERAADLGDVRDRALAVLLDVPMPRLPAPGHPFVLVAEDLAPAETARLDPGSVLAIVTRLGGPTGHTAILARSLGIPAVVACAEAHRLRDGVPVTVDGDRGEVVVRPAPERVAAAARRHRRRAVLAESAVGPGRTADGHRVELLLNLGGEEPESAAAHDCEGVGLLRTEFLFLDRRTEPTVEEQRTVYAELFRAFDGRVVTVRTLDAGTDKPLPFADPGTEPNPALGVRGFRIARTAPELLRRQLTAVARAARDTGAHVRVMAPMIATPEEAEEFAALARGAGLTEVGAVIEVPSAALLADRVLQRVDFVSIGTNDLSQYTLAADRTLDTLPDLLDPWQPALLHLVGRIGAAGRRLGRPVGVCGEAAADPLLALVLVGLGVTGLSMAAPALPAVRHALAGHSLRDCRDLAALALEAATPRRARAAVRDAADPAVTDL
ncbi:phosphoenolpyruvate--protein phosphotransferase [Thermobifida halotolerans]|uniref:Phosphoenolpyruvate-protein phosphotransferase n=1 Tax=Thermobifida halotolerans TaxID=483545 RepID=A0AA97M2U0_9ACTN|nr:phosphoenolpyruvate--protein phosphotransferase [Thermobifida halotolerans]UOE18488.1 phosphoenolpyruvate--protein phosphotransferase [Thermobifida halotolerans]